MYEEEIEVLEGLVADCQHIMYRFQEYSVSEILEAEKRVHTLNSVIAVLKGTEERPILPVEEEKVDCKSMSSSLYAKRAVLNAYCGAH